MSTTVTIAAITAMNATNAANSAAASAQAQAEEAAANARCGVVLAGPKPVSVAEMRTYADCVYRLYPVPHKPTGQVDPVACVLLVLTLVSLGVGAKIGVAVGESTGEKWALGVCFGLGGVLCGACGLALLALFVWGCKVALGIA